MKPTITPDAQSAITDIARRYRLSHEAVLAMLLAVHAGGGTMAQFSIPELGGSGQWMRGGMTMVGNMFDNALKARVDTLCNELGQLMATTTVSPTSTPQNQAGFSSTHWWPADLGVPSASGGQNDARYAIFPSTRRLAIQINGVTRVFDTGEHQIGGVQQQGGRSGTVSFTSQLGTFDLSSLSELSTPQVAQTPAAAPDPNQPADTPAEAAAPQHQPDPPPQSAAQTPPPEPLSSATGDPAAIVAAIESLAGLHQRGILSDEEFATKKAKLLGRI